MEEKWLVIDALMTLNNLIKFEQSSILKISKTEIKNFLKTIRAQDESFQEEIKSLGISKGYLEKGEEILEDKIYNFKQNIL